MFQRAVIALKPFHSFKTLFEAQLQEVLLIGKVYAQITLITKK